MKVVVSQFVLFFFIMLMLWVGVTYVSQNVQYSRAKQFFRDVTHSLQMSNFDNQVKQLCETEAKKRGYTLHVQLYGDDMRDARVTLTFAFLYPLIHKKETYTVEGYAR